MNMEDIGNVFGEYFFEAYENGKRAPKYDRYYHNVITQNFFTGVFQLLNAATGADIHLTHMATGTGTGAALKTNTALGIEAFRKALSSKSYTTTQFIAKLSLGTTESNFTIKEIGIFANATDTAGSGTLISRCLVDIAKNSNITYLITYKLTLI